MDAVDFDVVDDAARLAVLFFAAVLFLAELVAVLDEDAEGCVLVPEEAAAEPEFVDPPVVVPVDGVAEGLVVSSGVLGASEPFSVPEDSVSLAEPESVVPDWLASPFPEDSPDPVAVESLLVSDSEAEPEEFPVDPVSDAPELELVSAA